MKNSDGSIDYKALVEGLNDVIFLINLDGIFQYVSPSISNYGYAVEEIIGLSFSEFIHPDDLSGLVSDFEKTLSGERKSPLDFRVINKKGEVHWVRTSSSPNLNESGEVCGLTCLMVNISERRRNQEAVENHMHILNHDLRNPLSNVIGFSDLILDGDYSLDEIKKFVDIINKKALEMMEMMESYLTLEKVERGQSQLDLKEKPVSDLLSKINKIFSEFKNNKYKLSVIFKNPKNDFFNPEIVEKIVSVDKSLFLSMVTNLLKNALEALSLQKIEGKIVVNLFEENTYFCMSISNPGEIPEEFRKNLFQKFHTSKSNGTGLGLYSAKLIAEAHGGSLTYEPFPDGTRFTVRIPLQINF